MTSDTLIKLATYKLLHSKWKKTTCLVRPDQPWHPDVDKVWKKMTPYERAWYILYTMAEFYLDDEALQAICTTVQVYDKIHKELIDRSNAHRRSLTNLSAKDHKKREQDTTRRNMDRRETDEQRSSRYTARDVPWDMAAFDSDEDRIPERAIKEVVTPIYVGHQNGPVRRMTAAQYEAEKGPLSLRKKPAAV
jgi:hypothetical protein